MSDNVERHNSTRWARASVPNYGDEWGDEYDYDEHDEDQVEKSYRQLHNLSSHEEEPELEENVQTGHESSQRIVVDDNHVQNASSPQSSRTQEEPLRVPGENLVLSIDNFRSRQDSDSSDDEDFGIEPIPEEVLRQQANKEEGSGYKEQGEQEVGEEEQKSDVKNLPSIPSEQSSSHPQVAQHKAIDNRIRSSFEDHIMPPTPTYNNHFTPETPQSERSFASDTDSIQKESDLNVIRASSRKRPPEPMNEADYNVVDVHKHDTINEKSQRQNEEEEDVLPREPAGAAASVHDTSDSSDRHLTTSSSGPTSPISEAPTPLVLSIDNKDLNDSDSDSDDDDDWGYNANNASNSDSDDDDDDKKGDGWSFKSKSSDVNKSQEDVEIANTSSKGKDIDNLIDDLQNNSLIIDEGESSDGYLPSITPAQDTELPDFSNYDARDSDSKALDDDKELDSSKDVSPLPTEPLTISHKGSIRKPPPGRVDLVSVDYSNIADAVRDYLSDEEQQQNEKLNDIDEDNESLALQPTESSGSLSTGKFSFAPSHSSGTQFNEIKSAALPSLPTHQHGSQFNEIKTTGLPSLPPQPDSAGASSSVYSSVNPSPIDFMPPRSFDKSDLSRRDSTMTTNTFNMGAWQPNTNNFRDQFISDNENDGRMSYNPVLYDKETAANYNKFTQLGEVNEAESDEENDRTQDNFHDNHSSNSDLSIPDTIDAALPRVPDEDEDEDEDEEGDANISKINKIKTVDTLDSKPLSSGTFGESVLKDPPHSKGLFKEEKVTPMSSMLDVGNSSGKESSATTLKESGETENGGQRVVSKSSTKSNNTVVGGAYPPYDWKNIMSKSQSIDRIRLLKDASALESEYDSGLNHWLSATLKMSEESPTIHIGKIATAVYQNAPHSDIRRHNSLRTTLSIVKDKVETSGMQTSSLGKRFFHRSKKFIKSSD
ncbi:hypothetical protein CLIB1423_05S03202 [[Candida] railenensis]|uniref:Uncharacterized protein n=1 Tax=[Candida] railenensis TaxID=45579 RepID=A0A9P0VXK4_9ASCO|nr:hypothetical protein CLIB1423_05S03202 [[Candida] railenensis]